MTSAPATNPLAIHDAALLIADGAARERYLDEACAGDAVLRARVEAMLGIETSAGDGVPEVGRFLRGWSMARLRLFQSPDGAE